MLDMAQERTRDRHDQILEKASLDHSDRLSTDVFIRIPSAMMESEISISFHIKRIGIFILLNTQPKAFKPYGSQVYSFSETGHHVRSREVCTAVCKVICFENRS